MHDRALWTRPAAVTQASGASTALVGSYETVAAAILDYAERNDIDQIVMGARASSSLRRHLGSVSARVVAEAMCSVVVVRLKVRAEEAEEERPEELGDPAL